MEHPQNEVCTQRFGYIEERLDEGNKRMQALTDSLQANEINLAKVSTSLSGVAKALWAIVTLGSGALIGFFIWFIQNN